MPFRSNDPFANPFASMRSEFNAYLDVLTDEGSDLPLLFGPSLKSWPGRWRDHFAERMPAAPEALVLEIGSHFGEVILQMAADESEHAFLGMDITLKRVVKLAQKAKTSSLPNLTSLLCNARGLDLLFTDSELDAVLVFFPDPWAKKKRQKKNRLLQANFLEVLARKLKSDGYFWFKTDCEPYKDEVHEALKAAGWRRVETPNGIASRVYVSRFERTFRDQGLPTYASVWAPPRPECYPGPEDNPQS